MKYCSASYMDLASKSCRSYEIDDPSLDEQYIRRLLHIVEDWIRTNHRIQKHFHFNTRARLSDVSIRGNQETQHNDGILH